MKASMNSTIKLALAAMLGVLYAMPMSGSAQTTITETCIENCGEIGKVQTQQVVSETRGQTNVDGSSSTWTVTRPANDQTSVSNDLGECIRNCMGAASQ